MSDEFFRRSLMDLEDQGESGAEMFRADDAYAPEPEWGPSEGPLRVVPANEASALLRIKLPEHPPVPATTLRADAPPLERVYDAATAFASSSTNPSRPTALPGDVMALTTATMVVPLPASLMRAGAAARSGQRAARLTASVPPDLASRAEADLLSDTVEQFFGDFDAIGRELESNRAAVAAAARLDALGAAGVVGAAGIPEVESVPAPRPGEEHGASRYGVPTQVSGYDAARRSPVGMRYLGGIFHDSSGESSFYDPQTAALVSLGATGSAAVASEYRRSVAAPSAERPAAAARAAAAARGRAPVPPAPARPIPSQGSDQHQRRPERSARRSLSETQEIERPEHWRDHHPDHHRSKASPRRRRARLTLVSAVVSALAFGGVYGAALALEGQVPTGTVVDDVAIGGMTRSAAEAKLADVLGPVLAAPIRLTADGTPLTLDPEQAGLKVDWAATVAAASDGRDDPFVAIPALLGTKRGAGLRISIDRTALRAAIVEATSGFDRPLIEGGVTFPGGVPTPIAPRPGRVVDVDAAVGTVANAFTNGAATPASGNSSAAASSLGGDRVEPAAMAVAPHASPVTPTAPSSAPVSAKTPTALPTSAVPATPGTPTTPRAPKTPAPTPVPSGPSAIPTITLLVRDVQPTVTPAAVAQAMQDLARPAMSGPLTVVTGTIKTTLKPPVLGEYLAIVPDGHGGLVPRLDGAGVRTEIDQTALAKLEQSAVNAAFTVTDGKPVLVPGKTGIGYAPAAIDEAVLPALAEQQASQRTVTVPLGPLPPVLTTEAAGALGVTDVVGTYTAPLTASSQRAANVRRAADLVRGQIVQPGQTFSLNQALGARTAANGFVPAGASDTTGSQDAGAGASLVATALFNAEYLAGLKDVEHHPHAVATDRFPAGMEAALAYPDVDLKFQNDSGSPIYLWTQVTDNAVTVAVLGQKAYAAVQTEVSPHYEVVQPKTVTGSSGSCTVQDGVAGFQIDVTRILTKDGQEPVRQVFHTSYGAQDKIVCPAQGSSSGAANGPGAGSPQAMAPTPASTSGSSAAGTVGGTVGGTAGGTGGGGVTGGSTTPPATTSGPPSSWDGTLLGGLLGAPQPSKR